MAERVLKLLVVDDNPHDVDLVRAQLVDAGGETAFAVEAVGRLAAALERVGRKTWTWCCST